MLQSYLKSTALFVALAVFSVGSAHAELLEYSFVTGGGESRTAKPSQVFVNPVGNIEFALSAGIDRKVRITISNKDNAIVSTTSSHLLGPSDRITLGSNTYYGAKLTLPAPQEGEYTIKAEILSADNNSAQLDTYSMVVDTTPPVISGEITRGIASESLEVFGKNGYAEGGFGNIFIPASSDAYGISGANFFAIENSGNGTRREGKAALNSTDGRVSVLFSTLLNTAYMPIDRHYYKVGFDVYDKAGNKSTKSIISAKDDVLPDIDTQIFNPRNNTWEGYVSGMTIYENPVKIRYRRKKSDHTDFNGTKFGWITYFDGEDETYVYLSREATYPLSYSPVTFETFANREITLSPDHLTLVPDSSVVLGPEPTNIEYYAAIPTKSKEGNLVNVGWHSGQEYFVSAPANMNKVRITTKPRPYDQEVYAYSTFSPCVIPAGLTSCELVAPDNTVNSGRQYSPIPIYLRRNSDKALAIQYTYLYQFWDLSSPTIESTGIIKETGTVFTRVLDQDTYDGWSSYMFQTHIFKAYGVNQATGARLELPTLKTTILSYNRTESSFSFKALPDGVYKFEIQAIDTYGNVATSLINETVTVDNTPPLIEISVTDSGSIKSLDDVVITVKDTVDPLAKLTSISLKGGPANDNVQLSWREETQGRFRLEYPVMFPSLAIGESYDLGVTAQDTQGNTVYKKINFEYLPQQIKLVHGMDGKIMIPAVEYEFLHSNGSRIIETEPVTLSDGAVVTGSYDVFATLRSDAKVPLVVNGVLIQPGQTMGIMSQHNFGASSGKLSIPVKPAISDVVGSSSLLVMTSAPNSPIIVVDINTWKGAAKLTADSWNVRQVIDTIKITATQDAESGSVCRLTTKESEAKAADPIRDPVCLLEWDTKPDEAMPTSPVAGLVGQAVGIGVQPVSYSMYLYSGGTNKIKVGGGTQDLTVISAVGSVGYQVAETFSPVSRSIQLVNASLKQTVGNSCSLTISAERAKTEAANKSLDAASRTCVLEWLELPEGISQVGTTDTPKLSGYMDTNGTFPIKWRVSIFSKNGTRITLNDQALEVNVADPEAPKIEMLSKYLFKDNIYVVPMTGGYLGDSLVTSVNADLNVDILRNDESILSEKYAAGSSATNKMYRRVSTDDRKLWEETKYKVSALFSKLTDVKTVASYRVIAAPAESVKPVVEANGTSAIDTEALPITVNIRDQYKPNDVYNAETMGVWKVRLISQKSFNEVEPLSDFVDATNGTATFNADPSKVSAAYVRIAAEAVLQSPVDGYERTVVSTRPVFMTVLRGGAIDAGVTARRMSGAAPFTTVFKLGLTDRQDYRAAGSIIWETSTDGGNNWETYTPDERYKYQLVKTFEKGQYLVRAKVINKNSDAEAYTEIVEVIAYNQPQLTVNGPTTLFIGQEYNYTATPIINKEPVAPSDVQIDWSLDGGVTYTQSGPSITLSGDKESRIRLWTRVRDLGAPTDDPYAYKIVKSAIEIKGVKAPRTYVTGPNVIETDKTYVFKANVQLPYRGMDAQLNGFFTLPDGSIVEGDSIEYTPTEEDLAKTSIYTTYTAWIEGYRDQGAESTYSLKSRVWQYVWPKFNMQVRKTADVAPATITAVVRPVGFNGKLEEPTYEWVIPDGVTVEKNSQPSATAFVVNEPGEYLLKVIVRDARGHEAVVEQLLTIGQAAAYEIDLQYSASNPMMREPLDVLLRPYISGGHPRDRISTRTYSVDGTDLGSTGIYGRANLLAGDHKVKLTIQSEMGHEVEKEVTIPVAKNQLPSCSLTSRETVSSLMVYAVCKDPDGRMKSYEWTVNGERLSISSERITINKAAGESNPSVSLIGVDDSGGKSESVSL